MHTQVVAEYRTAEAQPGTQFTLYPILGESGRHGVHSRIDDVGEHDACQRPVADEPLIRPHVIEHETVFASIDRQFQVRVGQHRAMSWKMLANSDHAGATKPSGKSAGQFGDDIRFAVKSPVADDLADAPVQVDAGRKTQVDTDGA